MKKAICFFTLVLLLPPIMGRADNAATKLNRILYKFDSFNASMRTFQADIIQRKYLKILEEYDQSEKGKIQFKKTNQGILLKKQIDEPGNTILVVNEQELIIFYPKKNQALKRKIDNQQAKFANLGFGASSAEMKKHFDFQALNDEVVKNRVMHKILLTPTSSSIRNYFERLTLWIDAENGTPIRQRFEEQNGDYTDIQFFDIQINKPIKDKTFELKLPKDVEFIS